MKFGMKLSMKFGMVVIAIVVTIFCFGMPAIALNPEHLIQLRDTNKCANCDLSGADLTDISLRGSDLHGANLQGADLSKTLMMAVNLKGANLQEANLSGASLLMVDLQNAQLNGATIGNAVLKQVRFCHTITPSGIESNRDCS